MNEWLKSIKDDSLRDAVRDNILVTGGCIASMLTNEQVNDYDVYIMDMDVLKRLCEYYCKKYDVQIFDGRYKDELIRKEYGGLSVAEYDVAVRTLKPDQIKLYVGWGYPVEHKEDQLQVPYRVNFFSPNAISLSDDVQIVCRFHGNAEQIHKTFDFIHATNYWTFKAGLVLNVDALTSILTKQLKYQGSLYPLTSIIRLKKFLKRNWNVNAGEQLKIMFQISLLDLTDPDVLEEQLIGVDVAYFGKLVEILRSNEAKDMTTVYLNEIIDKVFGDSDIDDV